MVTIMTSVTEPRCNYISSSFKNCVMAGSNYFDLGPFHSESNKPSSYSSLNLSLPVLSPSSRLLLRHGSGFIAFLLMEEMEVEENLGPGCLMCSSRVVWGR